MTIIITAYADVCVALNDIGVNSGHKEKKPPNIGNSLRSFTKLLSASTAIPFKPSTGSSIILIHNTPLTAGITKKGDIKRTRTIPLPGKVLLINTAIENIPDEPFTYDSWDNWVKSISVKTGLKGKNLYMPLRLILTGKEKGPELKNFLPLLDRRTILSKFGKS